MFKKILLFAVMATVVSASPFKVFAEEKIALVSLQKAMYEVNDGKKIKTQIDKDIESKKKQIDSLKDQLKKESDDLEKQKLVLSQDALKTKTQALQGKFIEMQKTAAGFEQELRKKEFDASKQILDKLRSVVNEISKKEGYTLVIENSVNTVLYAQNASDITSQVIIAYNKKK